MTVRRLFTTLATTGALACAALLGTTGTASAQDTATTLSATGTGANEVPAGSGEAGASVTGSFQLTPSGALTYTVTVRGDAEPITAGHIHRGAAGANGAVVVPLDAAALNAGTTATTMIDPALAADILADPAGFYLNTHSASFAPPTGNARGQLTATTSTPGTIDTGTGGQAATGTGSGTATAVGGVAVLAVVGAGGVLIARRRGHAQP